MSTEEDKSKHSKRIHNDETAINKQIKIAKEHGFGFYDKVIKQPHRTYKKHVMDCGNPKCFLCGNPRKTHKDKLTAQEKRLFQDLDKQTNKHSNGVKDDEEGFI